MSEHDAKGAEAKSSVEELLDLLGLGGNAPAPVDLRSVKGPKAWRRPQSDADFDARAPLSSEILRCDDGVRRLHVYGCGRQPVKLSQSRCQAMVRSWQVLVRFASHSGRPGTRLTDEVAIREVNEVTVVEIGGEIGRPMRFTPEKLGKLLKAEKPIRQFAGR